MRLLIDGDGCPDIKIMEEIAQKYKVPMYIYVDSSHDIYTNYAEVIVFDTWSQSVDMQLVNIVMRGDIVVTQDYGVAVIALSRGASVVHPNGREYTDENMMMMLNEKYIHQKLRKQNIHMKGPKKRTSTNTKDLCKTLVRIIMQSV